MSEPILDVSHLNVYYGNYTAVRDLSFQLEAGDICALVGPNGAGKTSAIRAISGLYRHIRGDIKICGHAWEDNGRELTRNFGYMPDLFPVPEILKVREFLEHFALAFDIPNYQYRINELLELVRLKDKVDSDCSDLSRGMQQRLMLAKTLLHDPKLLVLDEPASGLDPKARSELKELLLSLGEQGKCILISSHILSELSAFCNKVAIMEKGVFKKFGRIDSISDEAQYIKVFFRWQKTTHLIEELLAPFELVQVQVKTERGEFYFDKNTSTDKEVLRTLVNANIQILEWRVSNIDLEQIYIEIGADEVT
ncbi:MAG: ABC transporter ATP-binding protein [Bdellovibrionales bacterium]|nr:ABC transporter ATP-binding protein [Bdellovibrionales bacterium]